MGTVRAYVWKDRVTGSRRPWNAALLLVEQPGEEAAPGQAFRHWSSAMQWADRVTRETEAWMS